MFFGYLFITEILTSSSTVIGGVVGAGVTVGIVCASVMGIVFFKRRKGLHLFKVSLSYEIIKANDILFPH